MKTLETHTVATQSIVVQSHSLGPQCNTHWAVYFCPTMADLSFLLVSLVKVPIVRQ